MCIIGHGSCEVANCSSLILVFQVLFLPAAVHVKSIDSMANSIWSSIIKSSYCPIVQLLKPIVSKAKNLTVAAKCNYWVWYYLLKDNKPWSQYYDFGCIG